METVEYAMSVTEYIDDGSNEGLCPYCGGRVGECDQDAEAHAFEEYVKAQEQIANATIKEE